MPHHWIRNHFCELVCFGVWYFKHARHIAHGVFCHHFTKGCNVGHSTVTIFARTVFNHLIAPCILDVCINIWHRNTVWVQETLEEQIIFQWVKLGNTECICQNGPCRRTTPWPIHDSLCFTPVNKVLHDKEITIVAHFVHHGKFVVNSWQNLMRFVAFFIGFF